AKAHIATVLDDLHAVAVELRLVLPAITARDGPGRYGHAGADEFREVATQKMLASMRPRCCRMTVMAVSTASASSSPHSTSMNTCFLLRVPLDVEVRVPRTITRPFGSRAFSSEITKRASAMVRS